MYECMYMFFYSFIWCPERALELGSSCEETSLAFCSDPEAASCPKSLLRNGADRLISR